MSAANLGRKHANRTAGDDPAGMLFIPGGIFAMGSERFYPEERPVRRVRVDSFWIDATPVTARQFGAFVAATGYVTAAERPPDPGLYPDMLGHLAQPAGMVFEKPSVKAVINDPSGWWRMVPGADWAHPLGPDHDLTQLGLWDHPVVQVAFEDAAAYAKWAGKALPTEAEHEFAARGGLDGREYAWGDDLIPDGVHLANLWQGLFPFANTCADGWERTSPVGSYPANGYGLYDMIGNVWEWTADWWNEPVTNDPAAGRKTCCIVSNPRGGRRDRSLDPSQPALRFPRKVLKGGSHLCAENYCQRYRPAARQPQTIDTAASHIGFRCVRRGRR